MKEATRIAGRAGAMLAQTVTTRHFYNSWGDYVRANWLRLTENRFTRRFAAKPGSRWSLRLRGEDHPIYLRRCNSDFHVLQEVFELGVYDPILGMNIPADATVLDLGGNIGLLALYAAHHYPKCRIVSVEPDGDNCAMVRANCAHLIESGRQTLLQGFAAAKDGTAWIKREGLSWSFQKSDAPVAGAESFPCFSVPTLCKMAGFDRVDLLKCDIEGSEIELFNDCRDWIGRVRNLVVETHGQWGPKELGEALRAAGWEHRVVFDTGSVTFLSAASSGK